MDSNHLPTNGELVHDAAFWWNVGVYMYVGRMGGNKGIEHMLTAWLDLRKQYGETCPDLWIVGGSPGEIDTVRQQVTFYESLFTLERQGHIRWWGYLDAKGVGALLLKALVLVMHSSYEPGGRVVLEAMSQGVPVIGTPHGFARDLVADGVNGFLVSYGDAEALSHRMSHFISQPLLSPSLGYAAKETARAALASWNFFGRHQDAYMTFGLTGGPPESKALDEPLNLIKNPLPQGLIGRFPFKERLPMMQMRPVSSKPIAARLSTMATFRRCLRRAVPLSGKRTRKRAALPSNIPTRYLPVVLSGTRPIPKRYIIL